MGEYDFASGPGGNAAAMSVAGAGKPETNAPEAYQVPDSGGSGAWDPTQSGVPVPTVKPIDGSGGAAPVKVSTEALGIYSGNLRILADALKPIKQKLSVVNIQPGSFYEAAELLKRVQGAASAAGSGVGGGIVPITADFIEKVINALVSTADGLDEMKKKYSNAEDLNKATAENLSNYIGDAQPYIAAAAGSSGSST